MERRREEERDARFLEAPLDDGRRGVDVHAERLEEIGAAALARDRPVAVLGDAHADAAHDQRRDRRDVEGVGIDRRRCRTCRTRDRISATARVARRRIVRARPTTSEGRSPFIARAIEKTGYLRRLRRDRP